MRRKGSDVFAPARLRDLENACAGIAPELIVETLAPFATNERMNRLRQVIDARLANVTVLMDAPHDPHNGAAIVRTCDAFGVQRLHVLERHETFLASHTVSRGSEKWVDVVTHRRIETVLAALDGFELVGTTMDGELVPEDLAAIPKLCVVLGNERQGIGDDLRGACRRMARVPMRGFAESLNVSVTCAILLYAATRPRPGDLGDTEKTALLARALLRSVEHARDILVARKILAR